jgi:tetratricopeptide (TPR) repeat protein
VKTTKFVMRISTAVALACTLALVAGFSTRAAAQGQAAPAPTAPAAAGTPGRVAGEVRDDMGQIVPGVIITMKNAAGVSVDVTADRFGQFAHNNLPPGNYTVILKQKDSVIYMTDIVLMPGEDKKLDFNFKEIKLKEAAEAAEAAKKAEEYRAAFAAMKVHFDAAVVALDAAKAKRAEVDKLPKDQQAAAESQVAQPATTAATEFQAALQGTAETDPNRAILLARLGEAYDLVHKYPEAADAYTKAVAIKPDPGSYNNLGNALARTGKVDDALAAYQKAIALDPSNTAMYWRNLAVGLYNSGRIKESVDPLRKATEADPKNAQAWYLLGAALVNTMEFKQDGEKLIPIITPGTTEAYQKAIDLDPNGPFGEQAKQGIEALQAMGLGVDTKIGSAPPAKNAKTPPKKSQ